ncbi:MAG: hypothetical protein U0531_20590 [Dehalococcoidia bacterium]
MDWPGTVVQRLMLGGVREVRLRSAGDGLPPVSSASASTSARLHLHAGRFR